MKTTMSFVPAVSVRPAPVVVKPAAQATKPVESKQTQDSSYINTLLTAFRL